MDKTTPKELAINQLDKIYTTGLDITKAYNSQYIPLNLLKELLKKSKIKLNKELKGFDDKWNKMLDVLLSVCTGYCDTYELNSKLPMIVFKRYIKELKTNL